MIVRRPAIAVFLFFLLSLTAGLPIAAPQKTISVPTSAFRLPVLSGVTVTVTQGNNQGDHIAMYGSEYAFDFIVGQQNFVITAAQGGTVIGLNDSSTIQCSGLNSEIAPESKPLQHCWAYANYVLIADDDGKTAALYVHLLPYSTNTQMPKVTIGEHVNQGDPIGLAGTTGWSSGVHLHFQVESLPSFASQQSQQPLGWWWTNSLPTTFSNPEVFAQDSDRVPKTGQKFTVSSNPTPTPKWSLTGNVALGRDHFQATTLPNGMVLIEGGYISGSAIPESELYNPRTGAWTVTGSLNQPRAEQSATLLQNGLVLVAGGFGPPLNSAELYNPATGTWTMTGSMSEVRTRDTETLLQNGEVLAAGGWNGDVTSGAELYDPTTGSWSSAGNMTSPRTNHIAVLLPNGKVLVAGGEPVNGGFPHTATAELYDPVTNTWTPTGSMNIGRSLFTAVLLPNGKVLVAGGCTDTGSTATAELYDPDTGTWTMTGSMRHARCLSQGQHAILLPTGKVLIVGGDNSNPTTSEIYDPTTRQWGSLTNLVGAHCAGATALLNDGQVLMVSGQDCNNSPNPVATAELYGFVSLL